MPKLIPQLEEHIINTAEKMFSKEGFDLVSMRTLAKELNIAVGTLYNYFPNKMVLFYSIMEKSWEKTFDELETVIKQTEKVDTNARERAIRIIYKGVQGRGGFALKTFGPSDIKKRSKVERTHHPFNNDELINKLEKALRPFGAGFTGTESGRLVRMLLASIRMFTFQSKTNNCEGDIKFLLNIIELT